MNMTELLLDNLNRVVFDIAPGAYLVGGYIRDTILGKKALDRDFIVKERPEKYALNLKNYIGGSIVILKDNLTVRVVLEEGVTVDFTRTEGSLLADLQRRDFTFNAMAYHPREGIHDPFNGRGDLEKRLIRMIRPENLMDDPVRIIRAYRFVGELDGKIDGNTREYIKKIKDNIKKAVPERITLEFFKLLDSQHCLRAVEECLRDSVIEEIFHLENNKLENIIEKLYFIEKKIKESPESFRKELNRVYSQGLTLKGVLVLETLVSFIKNSIDLADGCKLRMSGRLYKRIKAFRRHRKCLSTYSNDAELYDCFELLDEASLDSILYEGRTELIERVVEFKRIQQQPLLKGDEIMKLLEVKKGPQVGRLLRALKVAEFSGKIRTRADAERYLKMLAP